jgi:hypothetical protein
MMGMGQGSQGGTLPIFNSGSEQSGWSDASYDVKDSTSLSALFDIQQSSITLLCISIRQNFLTVRAHNPMYTMCTDGPGGSGAKCANVSAGGAIAFQGAPGDFKDMLSLAFSIRKPAGGTPDVDVNIGGNQVAGCLLADARMLLQFQVGHDQLIM